jgi:hypothetical protein
VPKLLRECWVPIHWMITAFVGFSFTIIHSLKSVKKNLNVLNFKITMYLKWAILCLRVVTLA